MNERVKKMKEIADHYGWDSQCQIAIEEMSELTKAICKRQREWSGSLLSESTESRERTEIIEEIADVWIMLVQLTYLLSADWEVDESINQKIERQLKRMEEE